jgi:hypothetical protein
MMVGLAASVYLPSNFTRLMIVARDRAYDIYWGKGGQFPRGAHRMLFDQSTRRRFIRLLGSAAATASPLAARAQQISRQPIFPKKDALAVFDISQPSATKRFYVLDFKSGLVTAHYAAHGRDNGPTARAIKFKGFQTDLDMVPLGPLKTAHSEVMDHYKTIVDRYDGTVYSNMIVVVLEGITSYNSYINHTPPFKWILHPNWYTTAAFRAKNNGVLGRSNGCITVDPIENNQLVRRLEDGALIYVTVGDDPIEQYL